MHASFISSSGLAQVRWACLHCGHAFDTTKDYWTLRAALGSRQ
jgi:acetone carboxylase gamma subunit